MFVVTYSGDLTLMVEMAVTENDQTASVIGGVI